LLEVFQPQGVLNVAFNGQDITIGQNLATDGE
jgi:hypothetical protein